jgi:lipopolysaccharide/colanic/teichoic acid biosynthesis glycosyltransferase
MKRFIDIVGAGVLIVFLAPLFALLSLLLLIDDGRPIIYRRRVVGQNGEFDAYKFRSMRRDADLILASNPALKLEFERNFKLKNDPRVTWSGAYIRKFSLDELPQLYNVVRGQMSLVGPRMITTAETDKYGLHKELLLSFKPGLTGYWQVHGRQDVSYEERVKMDMTYIKNWSLLMDVKILLLTPLKVFKREGAY